MEKVTMTQKEVTRLEVMQALEAGMMIGQEAAELLGVSERQVKRLRKAYREKGAAGMAHGNRGRRSGRRTPPETEREIAALVKAQYRDYNDQHLTEILDERHGIGVSRSTVRRIRIKHGVRSPKRRKAPQHRSRRERRARRGALLQIDASIHDWLEGRGPPLALIAFIDDATSEVIEAVFREQEDAAGYAEGLWRLCEREGVPLALYSDQRNVFGDLKTGDSQFKRIVEALGATMITAHSPQAKGRVERLFGTLQDRLVKALREANATTSDEANAVLTAYLPGHNARFSRAAAEATTAFRPWPEGLRPEAVFAFKHRRKVMRDNTLSFAGHKLQIPPQAHRRTFVQATVEVRQNMDGTLSVHHDGQCLVTFQPAHAGPVRVGQFVPATQPVRTTEQLVAPQKPVPAKPKSRQPYSPPPNHPWRQDQTRYRPKEQQP
jgi:transposase